MLAIRFATTVILVTEPILMYAAWLTRFGSNLIAVFISKLSSFWSCSLHLRPRVGYLIISAPVPAHPLLLLISNIPIMPVTTHPIVGVIWNRWVIVSGSRSLSCNHHNNQYALIFSRTFYTHRDFPLSNDDGCVLASYGDSSDTGWRDGLESILCRVVSCMRIQWTVWNTYRLDRAIV